MGTQISVEKHNLVAAGVVKNIEHKVVEDCAGTLDTFYFEVEGLPSTGLAFELAHDALITFDANHWGPNRAPLLQLLEKHEIPYTEG